MKEKIVEILCIGREILDGRVVDTNSTRIAQALQTVGLRPQYGQKVDDDADRVLEAFKIAAGRSQIVFVSGGLGPTSDDRTLEIFADFAGRSMVEYKEARAHLEKYLKDRQRPLTPAQEKQVYYPAGGQIVGNPFGTACGFDVEVDGTRWFFLPGPPRELLPMVENTIVPALGTRKKPVSYAWITHFTPEAHLQDLLGPLIQNLPAGWDFSFQARFPEVVLGLHGTESTLGEFEAKKKQIGQALAGLCWYEGPDPKRKIEEAFVDELRRQNTALVFVESCTGGLLAERITDVAGSSDVFLSSWVTYANEAKEALGVSHETLARWGAVSEAVALEMAEKGLAAAKKLCPAKRILCLSTTGVAGPGGGSAEKPVGLCHAALADSQGLSIPLKIEASRLLDRGGNRRYFSQKALDLGLRTLLKKP